MADKDDLIRRLREASRLLSVYTNMPKTKRIEVAASLDVVADALERHAVPREPSEKMIAAAQVLVMAASFPGAKAPLLKDLWQAMYDAAVVPANPRPEPEPVRMRDTTAIVDDMLGVSGGKAESEQTPEQAKDAAVATTQELMLDGIRPLSMRKLETDPCVVCGCQIAKGEKLCGECACEEDGP